jgi:UDP-N-acetyl-D-mannosaminuronic acid dehydrogenase
MIRTAREVNDGKPHYIVERVVQAANKFKSPVVACLGLAFKANIDDLRESPAVEIVEELAARKVARILVVEPHVDTLPRQLEGKVELTGANEAINAADIIVLLVDHKHFSRIRPERLQSCVVIDTRGFWSK